MIGTSHRQAPVKQVVGAVRAGLTRAVRAARRLGDRARQRRHDGVLGRRLVRPRRAAQRSTSCSASSRRSSPRSAPPRRTSATRSSSAAEPGDHPDADADDGVDVYALTHNETSTGVAMDLRRPAGTDGALVAVDATSGAGGLPWDPAEVDVYYFAPQKCFAADGGLWLAACSPAAVERIERHRRVGPLAPGVARPRHRPRPTAASTRRTTRRPSPRCCCSRRSSAGCSSRAGSTGASSAARRRPTTSTAGPRRGPWATPFVADPAKRSAVVGTIDLDDVASTPTKVSAALRANGIVDTDSYRKLGRNQLRIGMFPAIEPADVEALTACIDHLVEHHGGLARAVAVDRARRRRGR